MSQAWTALAVLEWTRGHFERSQCPSPRLDAEVLLAHVLGVERIQLYVSYERPLTVDERARYRQLVQRRASGEPVAYLVGQKEFWSIPFQVEPGVLIPRPDTEVLVEEALEEARRLQAQYGPALRIADVGTGSGCIAVALAAELPDVLVWAGDIAAKPLEVAPRNAEAAGVGERVRVREADGLRSLWEQSGSEPFHLVVSNPPYITESEFPGIMGDVRDHEPRIALVAGPDGTEILATLIGHAFTDGMLAVGGAVAVEVSGAHQAEQVQDLLRAGGAQEVRTRRDLANIPRVVVGLSANR